MKEGILKILMKHRGTRLDRIKATNYLDLDVVGEVVAEEIIAYMEEELVPSSEGGVLHWTEPGGAAPRGG